MYRTEKEIHQSSCFLHIWPTRLSLPSTIVPVPTNELVHGGGGMRITSIFCWKWIHVVYNYCNYLLFLEGFPYLKSALYTVLKGEFLLWNFYMVTTHCLSLLIACCCRLLLLPIVATYCHGQGVCYIGSLQWFDKTITLQPFPYCWSTRACCCHNECVGITAEVNTPYRVTNSDSKHVYAADSR